MFKIIWPERRFVTEAQIMLWYADAVANGDVENQDLSDPQAMARELDSSGVITLGT